MSDASQEVTLSEGLATTRSIRRYLPEPIPEDVLRDILFGATRAPSGSNRQPFRFMVFTDSEKSQQVKALIAQGAQKLWGNKRVNDGYDAGSGVVEDSPKTRMANTMENYVENFADVPVLVLAILLRYRDPNPMEGASVYPACQNLLLAARAKGYGGVLTGFHSYVEKDLRELLELPENAFIAATISLGKPAGNHGPVRRVPMNELIYADTWGEGASWAVDPDGTAVMKGR
jgi:nitroreductase